MLTHFEFKIILSFEIVRKYCYYESKTISKFVERKHVLVKKFLKTPLSSRKLEQNLEINK